MDKFPWKLSCLAGQLLRGAKPGDQGAWIEVVQRVSEVGLEGLEFPAPLPGQDQQPLVDALGKYRVAAVDVGMMANLPNRDLIGGDRTPAELRAVVTPSAKLAKLSGAGKFAWPCMEKPPPGVSLADFRARMIE